MSTVTFAERSVLKRQPLALVLALLLATRSAPAQEAATGEAGRTWDRTPPRLSFIDGEVSFWRPGAEDWAPARINTALAPGDALYTGTGANLELQIGGRAFVRAGELTQLGLENHEPDFLQFKLTAGHASLDLRALPSGHTVELDTPNAAFIVERTGYYRVDVTDDTTTFITRRGGRTTMTPSGGEAVVIAASEQVVIKGTEAPQVETYVAPEVDDWDRWNYRRTDRLIDAVSARYVPAGVYGIDALDYYGNWRVVATYGPVWVPESVPPGWVPYSTGRWMWDPYYGWTWVDEAPWGWAPFHYGRWVFVDGFWGWAPGPIVVAPVYAPALVAFFGGGGVSVRVGFGVPAVGWVALGWGEPLIPWWGPVGFVGAPCWIGWGGPRVVNKVVIHKTTVVNVKNITVYENMGHKAVVGVGRDRFGQDALPKRLNETEVRRLKPIHGELPVRPKAASLAPATGRAARPPEAVAKRPVVATRPPRDVSAPLRAHGLKIAPKEAAPAPRLVTAPPRKQPVPERRPPFGEQGTAERAKPSLPPRFKARPRPEQAPQPEERGKRIEAAGRPEREGRTKRLEGVRQPKPVPPALKVPRGSQPRRKEPSYAPPQTAPEPRAMEAPAPAPRAPAKIAPAQPPRELPGKPANRLFPGQPPAKVPRLESPASSAPRSGAPRKALSRPERGGSKERIR